MIVLIRGGGDLASGVAYRLHKSGFKVVINELPKPLAVRRQASFSEAIYAGEMTIEEVTAKKVAAIDDPLRILQLLSKGRIPVLVDPDGKSIQSVHPTVIVDARMLKTAPEPLRHSAKLYLGLGPGFIGGENCHAAIETQRGPWLGRVLWDGPTQPDSSLPEPISGKKSERVLYAMVSGNLTPHKAIGDLVEAGEPVAELAGQAVLAPCAGVLRGLIHPDVKIQAGMKIGDVDPRGDPQLCNHVSDKALAIGGAVLEAILSKADIRPHLWT
ncbi:MAG: molybdenum hydroxylase [Anaerolineales bacterium]|nr:EF2563 family selenium-dependent molybdenum hydroxylase system protein [Anaerolineae bacterium]PWB52388.1 MAG: molybdenum hydroxylase [Anaerolineales bacterium]